jgi:hypothetical protein
MYHLKKKVNGIDQMLICQVIIGVIIPRGVIKIHGFDNN